MKRYLNRRDAGQLLAREMQHYRGRQDLVVIGLPRGGLPVAAEVARDLQAPLDIVVVRKMGVLSQPEVTMGALAAMAGKGVSVATAPGVRPRRLPGAWWFWLTTGWRRVRPCGPPSRPCVPKTRSE